MTYEAIIKRRVRGDTHVCLLIVACLFSCWLASTQHAQSAITPLMKPDPWSQNIITQKVQIILQIKMKSVFKDRICGLITEDFTYDYEINSEGTFQYAPDFSLFSLYGYNEALAPKQIRIRDASGYWIRFESGCQGGTRHNYSTHQVQYNDWAYYDLRIEHPPRSEHCNVYFDNHVYLRFPGYSGNVLTSPEPGFYYDTENIDYMVTPAIMQQAVREGSYHKTLQVRRGDGSEYRDLTLDITVLFEPKEEGVLKVTPPDGLDDSCPSSNCDFKSLAKSYTLTNAGSSPINYTVSKTASWLELTSTGGVLQPGASTTVTASISVEAQKELKEGVHKDTLVFTNTTNRKGNTSRAVKLEKSERQCWRVTLAGQETDDMGGSLMTIKMENVWKQVTVDYGVRFDYQLVAEFNIKKKDGAWVYNEGRIVEAKVGLSQNFDPDVFFISKMVCQNCNKIANLKGQSLSGSVQGQTVNLKWPDVMTSAIVTNKIKLKFVSKEKSQEGYSDNYFISEDFFHWTWTHNLPLIDNKEVKFQMEKKNSKSRFKLDKRPPISLYYRYVLKKIK